MSNRQAAIRELFLERIVTARGIEELRHWAEGGCRPRVRSSMRQRFSLTARRDWAPWSSSISAVPPRMRIRWLRAATRCDHPGPLEPRVSGPSKAIRLRVSATGGDALGANGAQDRCDGREFAR